jgi:hypothetical protein
MWEAPRLAARSICSFSSLCQMTGCQRKRNNRWRGFSVELNAFIERISSCRGHGFLIAEKLEFSCRSEPSPSLEIEYHYEAYDNA